MSAPQHGKPLAGHAFRITGFYPSRTFVCECGVEVGKQPTVGQQKARRLHREHKAQIAADLGVSDSENTQ